MNEQIIERAYWIKAYPPASISDKMPLAKNIGKWCIFVHRDDLDVVWPWVRRATRCGMFWRGSKVSTAWAQNMYRLRNPSANPDEHVICVYSYDYRDENDVKRIRQALYRIGVEQPLGYKTDADTSAGIERWTYADSGWTR
jgi:hypothetical protein